jgi:replication factor A1
MRYYGDKPIRGRPRGNQSYSTTTILSSIAHIAAKNNLNPMVLLDAFKEAWMHEESKCGKLKVECRKADYDYATFLITCDDKVIWQFPIKIEIIQNPELFKSFIPIASAPAQIHGEDNSKQKSICELKAKMRGITVKARIVEVPPRKLVNTRYGSEAFVSNILLADKTGTIRLGLWNNQINDVAVGDTVNIEKASVATFSGQLQLRIGRNGKISVDSSTRERITV